jgi:hypothetical protein
MGFSGTFSLETHANNTPYYKRRTKQMEMYNLTQAAKAASHGDVESQKLLTEKGMLLAKTVTEALCLQPGEEIHWFFSPYRKSRPEGVVGTFVIPEPNVRYSFDFLHTVCWIEKDGKITSTLKIYICFRGQKYDTGFGFPPTDRYAIGSGMPFLLDYITEMVCDHMRHGKGMQGGYNIERSLVENEVLPLLCR